MDEMALSKGGVEGLRQRSIELLTFADAVRCLSPGLAALITSNTFTPLNLAEYFHTFDGCVSLINLLFE